MTMPDGNSAALKKHEAEQDRLDRQAPTEDELERYVEDWLERKRDKIGIEFIMEALNECDDDGRILLFCAFRDESAADLGHIVRNTVNRYWRPMAEKAAETHNFEEDRRE